MITRFQRIRGEGGLGIAGRSAQYLRMLPRSPIGFLLIASALFLAEGRATGVAAQDLPAGEQRPAENDAGQFPVDGTSTGGRVRAGPSTKTAILATLAPGTSVRVVGGRTDGAGRHQWMEIEWQGGRAWHWGGLICTKRRTFGVAGYCP